MSILVQNQGMGEIFPQAYTSEDTIESITPRLGEKTILQEARLVVITFVPVIGA
jgi:hypothetical protein